MKKHWLMIALMTSSISACSIFTPPKEKPVIEDSVGTRIGTLATTAERRVVLVDLEHGKYCSEAPPDVAESINSSIRAAVEAGMTNPSANDIKVKGEVARQLATSVNTLFSRTQGVQLFRDGSFALCQARMNGYMKDEAFVTRYDNLLNQVIELIKQELPMVAQRFTQQVVSNAQTAAADAKAAAVEAKGAADTAAKSAEAAKGSADAATKAAGK